MCGIAGMVGGVDERALRVMTQTLRHRGPDDGAIWIDAEAGVGFGHRRLAIIDPRPLARQPMRSADGRHTLTFNGEIFNFRALRDELERAGRRFRTASDAEVLLAALEHWGESALERIEGQFAFAWWDAEARQLLLARDHLGIKPLYVTQRGGALRFASEIKALLAVDDGLRRMNTRMLSRYLAFLWVPDDATMFDGVERLAPGSVLVWHDGTVRTRRYWDVVDRALHPAPVAGDRSARASEVAAHLRRSVREQLVADVPLGILLSGGLDSTIILAAAAEAGAPPAAFTASYAAASRAADVFDDDAPYARRAAAHYGAVLHEAALEQRVRELLPVAVWHLDEPLGDPSILVNHELTRAARAHMTVLLSGMGADELFAGYPRHPALHYGTLPALLPAALPRAAAALVRAAVQLRMLPPVRARRLLHVLDRLHGTARDRFLAYATYNTAAAQRALLTPALAAEADVDGAASFHIDLWERLAGASPLQRALVTDLCTFLPAMNLENTDKTAMANAVEVRVPFLDRALVEYALALPDGDRIRRMQRKALLREAFAPVLPAGILTRPKTGYAPPVRGWVRGMLRDDLRETVQESLVARGIVQAPAVARMLAENDAGTHDHAVQLWQLHVLEHWFRRFIDRFDAPPCAPLDELAVIS